MFALVASALNYLGTVAFGVPLGYVTAEGLAEVSDTSTSWLDVAALAFPAGSQLASNDYLGFWSVEGQGSTTSSTMTARVELNGSSLFTINPEVLPREVTSPLDYQSFGGMFRYQPGANPADATFKVQVARGTNAATFKGRNARVSLLKMGADDHYAESIARQTFADPANKTSQTAATLSFTPSATGNFIIVASFNADLTTSTNVSFYWELTDGTTTTGEHSMRPPQTADRVPCTIILPLTAISGAKTITLKIRQGGIGNTGIGISEIRLFAIREDRFANIYKTTLGSNSTGSQTTYTDALTQTFTPAAADHLTIVGCTTGADSTTISAYADFEDDAVQVNEHIREYGLALDGQGVHFISHRLANYAASSRTQRLRRKAEASQTVTIQQTAAIVAFDLTGLLTGSGGGPDPYWTSVKLLMGFEGTDGSTTMPDESSAAHGNATVFNQAQIDTGQFKFGASSLLLDAVDDRLTYADSADWNLGAGDFTVEAWVRFNGVANFQTVISQWATTGTNQAWLFDYVGTGGLLRFAYSTLGFDTVGVQGAWVPSTNVWYHVAASRVGNTLYLFADGALITSASVSGVTIFNSTADLRIGTVESGGSEANDFDGWIDELRLTKGVGRYTGAFTVPTAAFPRT